MEPQCAVQVQPRRLKDFLQDQTLPFPRSRKSTFSVFLHAAVKSSAILRRRFSKSKSSSSSPEPTIARTTSVTVKDILRWRSFRDPVESYVPQLPESPSRCSVTTSDTTSRSSWSDSDFTVGDSPVWCRGNSGEIEVAGKTNLCINVAGGERLRREHRDVKEPIVHVEDEQFSPMSVLDFKQEHAESFSPFHQILANIERRNITLKQQIQDFENTIKVDQCFKLDDVESFEIEERSIQLLDHVKTTSSIEEWDVHMDCLLLDFIRNELITAKRVKNSGEFESRILSTAKSWVRGEDDGSLAWEMEERVNWKNFEDDQEEIGIEIEKMVLNHLLDELSIELVNF